MKREDRINMEDNDPPRNDSNASYVTYDNGGLSNHGYVNSSRYNPTPQYSRAPPHQRSQYTPQYPHPPGSKQFQPPAFEERSPRSDRGRGHRNSYSSSEPDGYESDRSRRSRPRPVTRRSSSYQGSSRKSDMAGSHRHGGLTEKVRDIAHHYGVKDELDGIFTSSKAGLGGAAVGAVVAGWVAHKAQETTGKRMKHGDEVTDGFLTLLGAAVGGLAVNAVVDKYEQSKGNTGDEQDKRDKDGRGKDASKRGGRRRENSGSDDGYRQ